MFQEAYTKLDLADVATILDQVNPAFDGGNFDPVETTIMAVDMPFYPGYRFLEISNHSVSPPMERFVVYSPENFTVLDFSNEPIYALNKDVPILLDDSTVCEYVRFFFTHVRGRHGRFLISEGVDDIQWKEEPPPAARKAIGKMLKVLDIKEKGKDGSYKMEATMMFKDSLFKSDVEVSPEGAVSLVNEELLVEDMPVLDDTFGQ
ncbi:MAG: hypothetical protein KDJ35_05070 [Alphaproteobacteria bacterium]|nr:hypothetical protein [Alphaproteobacteria bacterium]